MKLSNGVKNQDKEAKKAGMIWGGMEGEWNRDLHLRGMVDGYIMERDRILTKRRMVERKEEFEEMIRRGVKMELEKIMG